MARRGRGMIDALRPPILINDLSRHHAATEQAVRASIDRVLASGRFILGDEGHAFEREFANYLGVEHCVATANGTDALELALRMLGIDRGDAVATAANAGYYASTAIAAVGAMPVYVDVDATSHTINAANLDQALTRHSVRAVVVTHLYGLMADMATILQVADRYGVPVIEDCAQAHGARRDGRAAGAWGAAGCFSFYPTKNLGALGDGGAVVTTDAGRAAMLRALRQYGWSAKYCVELRGGRNSRLDEIQAAVLRAKLPRLDTWNRRRRDIAARYSAGIRHPRIACPPAHGEDYVAHLFVVTTDDRDGLARHLAARGIATDIHYPIPDYRQIGGFGQTAEFPVTDRLTDRVLTLPCYPELADTEVDAVIAHINTW